MLNIVWLLPGGVDADTQCRWGQAGSEPDGQTPHICKIQIRSQTNTNTKSDKYKYNTKSDKFRYKARQTDSSSMQNTEIQLKYTKLDLS